MGKISGPPLEKILGAPLSAYDIRNDTTNSMIMYILMLGKIKGIFGVWSVAVPGRGWVGIRAMAPQRPITGGQHVF